MFTNSTVELAFLKMMDTVLILEFQRNTKSLKKWETFKDSEFFLLNICYLCIYRAVTAILSSILKRDLKNIHRNVHIKHIKHSLESFPGQTEKGVGSVWHRMLRRPEPWPTDSPAQVSLLLDEAGQQFCPGSSCGHLRWLPARAPGVARSPLCV